MLFLYLINNLLMENLEDMAILTKKLVVKIFNCYSVIHDLCLTYVLHSFAFDSLIKSLSAHIKGNHIIENASNNNVAFQCLSNSEDLVICFNPEITFPIYMIYY